MSENVHFRSTTRHMLRESQNYVNQTLMGGLSGFESPIGLDRRDRINALKSGDIGFVHSWDINTSVDGPGTRMTVFMSGCPLRCQYCQNPDTWKMRDGKPVYYEAMVKKIERYVDLFKGDAWRYHLLGRRIHDATGVCFPRVPCGQGDGRAHLPRYFRIPWRKLYRRHAERHRPVSA